MIVFVGPTLGAAALHAPAGFTFLPPAACGDIARAAAARPAAIGLIDGRFETERAPRHKEILWALAHGIPVFGAASLGALRAVECERFGMVGVGRVFRAFRAGRLTADDEVAVLHGPREAGYPAVSEALVNVRATLARARRAGAIDRALHADLLGRACATFYKDRSYDALLAALPARARRRLAGWLAAHRVDVKRDDALAMLRALRARSEPRPFAFPRTRYWTDLCRDLGIRG